MKQWRFETLFRAAQTLNSVLNSVSVELFCFLELPPEFLLHSLALFPVSCHELPLVLAEQTLNALVYPWIIVRETRLLTDVFWMVQDCPRRAR